MAEQLGWAIAAEHTDNDLSAYSGKPRPGYRALLADVAEGRADAVLAWHTDRLHRSPVELETYIATCDPRGVPTHCVTAGPLDLSSPSGRLVARQLGAVARYEVEHSVERQKRAKLQAARDGKFRGGRRAFGYESDGVTIRESEAAIVRRMADSVIAGASLRSVADGLNSEGCTGTRGARWTGASVHHVLINPRNAALIQHEGDIIGPARWPPVLPEETWRAVRSILCAPGRSPARSPGRRWLGSGVYLCGRCGEPVRIGSGGRTRPSMRPYYRCSGRAMHVARVADHVDELVSAVVVERLSRPDAVDLLAVPPDRDDPIKLHAEANAARARLDELATMFAADRITGAQLAGGSESLRNTLADLDRRIGTAYVGSVLDGIAGHSDAAKQWEACPLDRRRAIVDSLLSVTILPGKAGRKPGGHYFDPESVQIDWNGAT